MSELWGEIWEEMPPWHGHEIQAERRWTFVCECGEHAHFGNHTDRELAVLAHVRLKHPVERPVIHFRTQQRVPCTDCKAEQRGKLEGWL